MVPWVVGPAVRSNPRIPDDFLDDAAVVTVRTVRGGDSLREQDTGPLPGAAAIVAANSSVDWRTSGCVNPVKDQAKCGRKVLKS